MDAPVRDDRPQFELADDAPAPSANAAESDRFGLLQRGIDQLPQRLKEVLILFSLEERSQEEVAELLGITPKAVETRVYHAKAKLRMLLENEMRLDGP